MREVWGTRRAVTLNVVLIVLLPAFALLCYWQVRRAVSGNELSWAYVFEWPFFGAYAVFVWWRLVHQTPDKSEAHLPSEPLPGQEAALDEPSQERSAQDAALAAQGAERSAEEAELAAYNRYLAELHASGARKRW
jgi:hypothetical protein